MTRAFTPLSPSRLVAELAVRLDAWPAPGAALRVALDGPPCAGPAELAARLAEALRALGRSVAVLDVTAFWRDAALRLEPGREDAASYPDWLDAGAVRREVLAPLGPGGAGTFLPSLRDPSTNRATRARPVAATSGQVVVLAGPFLLGLGLDFDVVLHLAVSPGARARRTEEMWAWTLPAFDRYDAEVAPRDLADIVIRFDDPAHPAVAFG